MIYSVRHLPRVINIGVQTETGVVGIGFDVRPWLEQYGYLEFGVWPTRPGETTAYPAADVKLIEGILYWQPDETDTAIPGNGKVEIIGITAEKRKLSGACETSIRATSLPTDPEIPDANRPWVDQVIAAGNMAVSAANAAAESSDRAAASEEAAKESETRSAAGADVAASSADSAYTSASNAAQSADRAEAALSNARQASDSARISALNAEQASADARKAVDNVENISKSLYGLDANYTKEIPAGADFDDYLTPGNYSVVSGKIAGQIANIPRALSGRLTVYTTTEDKYVVQEYVTNSTSPYIYRRSYTSGKWNPWRKIATIDETINVTGVLVTKDNYTSHFTSFDDIPVNTVYNIAYGVELDNAPPGNTTLNSKDSELEYMAGTVVTMSGSSDGGEIRGRFQIFMSSSTLIDQSVFCFRNAYTRDDVLYWSKWQKLTEVSALTASNIVIRKATADRFFDDLDNAPINSIYQLDLDCDEDALKHHPNPGQSCVLVTLGYSYVSRHGMVQMCFGLGGDTKMFYRYGYIQSAEEYVWTGWKRVVTTTDVDAIVKQHNADISALAEQKADRIECSASGSVITVTDAAARPAVEVVSTITAVQEGEGDPSPDNVRPIVGWDSASVQRTRKNLISPTHKTQTLNGVTFTYTTDGRLEVSGTATKNTHFNIAKVYIKAGVPYTLSGVTGGSNKTWQLYANGAKNPDVQWYCATKPGTCEVLNDDTVNVNFAVYVDTTVDLIVYPQFEIGTTATEYEPYQGQTLTAELPETVYGGRLDWTTGMLTVNIAMDDMTDKDWFVSTKLEGRYIYQYLSGVVESFVVCSHYPKGTSVTHNAWYKSGAQFIVNTGIQTMEEWKAYLAAQAAAGTPFQVCYKLATPYTIQLTPQQLDMLKGTNNVWSDCGDTSLVYVADTKLYIDSKFDALQAAILSHGANV